MRAIPSATMKQLLSASGLALATALVAAGPRLAAQGFNAAGTVVAGTATINSTPTTSAITVSTPSAVINWVPTDTPAAGAPYNFQDSFQTTTYQNDFNIDDFAVLNRIIPADATRPVRFNGRVISQLQQLSGPTVRGGTLFFYSPGGILIGGSSTFDVGNLALTTSDIAYDAAGNFGTGGSYVFQPATVPGAQIVVSAGAQLNASVDGSYIAMVAPSVVNNGTINVNGAAALVAADAATIRFSPSGLFDIEVTSGTSASGTVAANNGTITGPAAASATTFFHRVYMVAVPKNDAITMAIGAGSALGFDIAGAADQQGNAIVLSAGQDVANGNIGTGPSLGGGSGKASITGGDSLFASAVEAQTTGTINLEAAQPNGLVFAGQAVLRASGGDSSITARAGSGVVFDQFLQFSASVNGTATNPDALAGNIALRAENGGVINATGSVDLTANGFGAPSTVVGTNSGSGTGGSILVEALNGGQINFDAELLAKADGAGGVPETGSIGIGGGAGIGGTVTFRSGGTANSAIQISSGLVATAAGLGANGNGCTTCLFDGATGTAGAVALLTDGTVNRIDVLGLTDIAARAIGGASAVGNGGSATAGSITVRATNGADMTLEAFNGYAEAQGGSSDSGVGGSANGGSVFISASGTGDGGIRATGPMLIEANATGGLGQSSISPGGMATGGAITIAGRDEKFVVVEGDLLASSNAKGGIGFGAAATGTGGTVTLEATTAGFTGVTGLASLAARGDGGDVFDAPVAGLGTGGVATVVSVGGTVRLSGEVFVDAQGRGGAQLTNGTAGTGQGGTAQIGVGGSGVIDLQQSVQVRAGGIGGSAGSGPSTVGGDGIGGNARLGLDGGTLNVAGELTLDSAGSGGGGGDRGGNGLGGTTSIIQNGSELTVGNSSYIGATGTGGTAFFGPTGGNGTGGSIVVLSTGSNADFATAGIATFEATGFGASGTTAGTGAGGDITVTATASTIRAGAELQFFAEGQGATGSFLGSDGADGTGGEITLSATGDVSGESLITAPSMNISAAGRGGNGTSSLGSAGGSGGDGLGGIISLVSAPDGGTIDAQQLTVNATGNGGLGANVTFSSGSGQDAGSGGSATGGQINFASVRGTGTTAGGFILGDAVINAGATGANGGTGGAGTPSGRGGSGGNATGGAIDMVFDAGGSSLSVSGVLQVFANATGGNTGPCVTACVVSAGTATGGTVAIGSDGLTVDNAIFASQIQLSAFAEAGNSAAASGAQATGGNVMLKLGSGMGLTSADVSLNASARGGDSTSSNGTNLTGGSAVGGNAAFTASGSSSVSVSGEVRLIANGNGGLSLGPSGTGGSGTGGTVRLSSDGGTIEIEQGVQLQANGLGGNGNLSDATGTGGAAIGGTAVLAAGGLGQLGNNGRISVLGLVDSSADAGGGAGFVAGSATGGLAALTARQGTLGLNSVLITANAFGGGGIAGGAGAAATAGTVDVVAHSAVQGAALVEATSLTVQATARGGEGGEALDPNAVGATGGLARGGSISVLGSAGNGRLDIESAAFSAEAIGGTGGTTVSNIGGSGGLASGGTVQLGVTSGIDTGAVNAGSARFGEVFATASGTGGSGGTANSSGGTGGNASGGGIALLAQGGAVLIESPATFDANAIGGAGGNSITIGNGGNGTIGSLANPTSVSGVRVQVAERAGQPAQRGSLTVTDLAMTTSASGGTGTVNGTSTIVGTALGFVIGNGTVSATNLAMTAAADSVGPAASADIFAISNGTAQITSGLTIQTPNAFSLTLDTASVTADLVSITAGNWVLTGPAPANLGTLTGTSALQLSSGLDLVAHANLRSGSSINLSATGRIAFGAVRSFGGIVADAGSSLTLGDVTSDQDIALTAATDIVTAIVSALGPVTIATGGNVTTSAITSGSGLPSATGLGQIAINAGGNISTANLSSSADVLLYGQGTIETGRISAYDALVLGRGNIALGGFDRANRVLVADRAMALPVSGVTPTKEQIFSASPIATAGSVSFAGPSTLGSLRIAAGTTVALAALNTTGNVAISGAGNAVVADIVGGGLVSLSSGAGTVQAGAVTGTLGVSVSAATGLTVGAVDGAAVSLSSGGATIAGNITAGSGNATVLAAGTTTLGNVTSAGSVNLSSTGGMLKAGNINGSASVVANGATGLELGAVSGSAVALRSNAAIIAGNVGAGSGGLRIAAGAGIQAGNLVSAQDVTIVSGGNLGAGLVQGVDALLLASGNVQLGSLALSGRGLIANASMAATGNQQSPGTLAGPIDKEPIFASVPAATGGTVTITGNAAVGSLRIASGAQVSTGNVVASGNIGVTSGGGGSFATLRSTAGNIELISPTGTLSATAIDARLDVLARAGTGLNLQTVAGRDIALLSGGGVQVDSVRAGVVQNAATGAITGATGRLLIANAAMLPSTALPGSIGYAALFAAAPVAAGGAVDITRSAIAGRITGASTGAFRGSELTGFERIDVTAGARVTVAERWTSPIVRIAGTDIAILNNGSSPGASGQPLLSGIRTTADGSVDIVSTSSAPALIGDGLTGQGSFALGSDEIGLISTSRLTISAIDSPSNAIDMQIGNLSLTAGSSIGAATLSGSTGKIILATGNAATQTAGGTIRVTGAINGSGFGSGNILEFSTGTFELDAATGSISLASTGATLGGIARINASRIHVASADILAKLAADPLYTGRIADLNAPAVVQRPDGVLRALGLDLFPTGTLYIQNTGTTLNPAGFFSDIAFTDVTAPANAQARSISIVVNGAFQTPTGIVSAVDAHDLAIAGVIDPAVFSEDSQINSCLLSVSRCVTQVGGDGEPDIIGAIAGQIAFNAQDPLGSTPGMAEPDDNSEDDTDPPILPGDNGIVAGPIVPPTAIIKSDALDTTPPIEEPVTGGGNSALYGTMMSGTGNLQGENQ